MKIIKFRAYDKLPMQKLEKSFTYFTLEDLNSGKIKFPDMENWEISMFTGLLDRNSKEIYEGDIVKTGNMLGFVDWGEVFVDFGGEGHGEDFGNVITYVVETKSAPEALSNLLVEILGNIYEHEELLTNN